MPLASVLALPSGCAGEGAPGGVAEATVIPVEDVEVVASSERISRVRDLVLADDGGVWVLNEAPPLVLAFTPDGQLASARGERGEGPSEIRSPSALAVLPASAADGGGVWLYDFGRHAMIRVDIEGELGSEVVSFPRDEVPAGRLISFDEAGLGGGRTWIRGVEEGFLAARRPEDAGAPTVAAWDAEIVVLGADDGAPVVRYAADDLLGDPSERYGTASILLPLPLWAPCPDGTTVLYDPLDNRLRRFGPDGSEGASASLPPEREVALTADRVYGILLPRMLEEVPEHQRPPDDELRASFDEEWDEASGQFAETFPEFATMHCTGAAVWLQPFDSSEGSSVGRGPAWWRVEPWEEDGAEARIREARLPRAFTPYRFTDHSVWGTLRDELDVPSVATIELP